VKQNAIWKSVTLFIIYGAFIVYVPIGLAIVCPWTKDPQGNWDYSQCLSTNLMRSVTQWIMVIMLLIYIGFVRISADPRKLLLVPLFFSV
jgi:hypothetical protein